MKWPVTATPGLFNARVKLMVGDKGADEFTLPSASTLSFYERLDWLVPPGLVGVGIVPDERPYSVAQHAKCGLSDFPILYVRWEPEGHYTIDLGAVPWHFFDESFDDDTKWSTVQAKIKKLGWRLSA